MIKYIDKYFLKKPKLRRFVTQLTEGSKNRKIDLLGSIVTVNSIEEHGYRRSSRFINSSAFLREEIPVLLNIANLPSFLQSHRFKLFNAKTLLPYNGYDQQILAIHKKFSKL